MMIAIGCDHAGFELKEKVKTLLGELGHEINDVGCHSAEHSVDYPDLAGEVANSVTNGQCDRGILICGTGIGMTMVANKFRGARAALCHDVYSAEMSRAHNDANVLCMGGRVIGPALADQIVKRWLATPFEGGRHANRVKKVDELGG